MKNTDERILDAATRIFAKEGVSGATTRKIALAAKVNEVTLFRHFKSKEELLRQVVLQCSKRFAHVFNEAPFETKADLRRTIQTFATNYTKMLRDNEDFIRTFFGEMTRHPELCRRLFVDSAKPLRLKLIAYLLAAQKSRVIRQDLDIPTTADALTGMLVIGMIRRPLTESIYTSERYNKTCVELFIRGVEP
jgi:AcrR family transcriptional regulator